MNLEGYLRQDYVAKLVKEGKRLDGRKFDEFREIKIEKDYVGDKADGSAFVQVGDTKVLVGISTDVGEPYADSPATGVMTVGAELRPIASPHFETGPPNPTSIELARVVDRGIRESGSIATDKLSLEDGKVWIVFIDIHMLDNSGNMMDAAGIAAITALLNTRLPKYEDGRIIRGEYAGKLPMTCSPIPITTAKIGDKLLIDPTEDEEYAMDSRLTVGTTDTINSMQKGGIGSLTEDEIMQAVDLSFKKGADIRKMIEGL